MRPARPVPRHGQESRQRDRRGVNPFEIPGPDVHGAGTGFASGTGVTLPPRARGFLPYLAWLLPLALVFACLGPEPKADTYIAIRIADTLTGYDTVRILLLEPGSLEVVEVVWDGPLPDRASLDRLKVEKYSGGKVVVEIIGLQGGEIAYRRFIHFGPQGVTRVDTVDVTRPRIVFQGGDTTVVQGESYVDTGAVCMDDRDPARSIRSEDRVDTANLGDYTLRYECTDRAGNEAKQVSRKVRVVGWNPGVPEITLRGRDTVAHIKNLAYADSGATCFDPEDGALIPILSGEVLIHSVGEYTLTYACKDKDGNSAPPRTRTVKVAEAPDVTPPVLSLKGADSLNHPRGRPYSDSGAACVDPRDGNRPVTVTGEVHIQSTGRYVLTYSCQDLAGNQAAPKTRVVRVFAVVPEIPAAKEGHVDTSEAAPMASYGYTPFIRFAKFPGPDPWVSVVQFSLDGLTLTGVKSASGVFRCFLWGRAPAVPDSFPVVFHIDRVKEQWIEGNGNPYYHSGGWQGGGDTILANHPFRTEILSGSTPITVISGMDKRFKHVVREGNLIPIGKDTVVIKARASQYSGGDPGVIPAGAELFTVEIDLMDYIRKTDSSNDFGLTIRTEGMPAGVWLGWATKELGDGSYRPRMYLEY